MCNDRELRDPIRPQPLSPRAHRHFLPTGRPREAADTHLQPTDEAQLDDWTAKLHLGLILSLWPLWRNRGRAGKGLASTSSGGSAKDLGGQRLFLKLGAVRAPEKWRWSRGALALPGPPPRRRMQKPAKVGRGCEGVRPSGANPSEDADWGIRFWSGQTLDSTATSLGVQIIRVLAQRLTPD